MQAPGWPVPRACLVLLGPLGLALGGGFAWAGGWLPVNLYRLCGENVPIALWNFCGQKCGFPVVHFWPVCCFSSQGVCPMAGVSGFGLPPLGKMLWLGKAKVWCDAFEVVKPHD